MSDKMLFEKLKAILIYIEKEANKSLENLRSLHKLFFLIDTFKEIL